MIHRLAALVGIAVVAALTSGAAASARVDGWPEVALTDLRGNSRTLRELSTTLAPAPRVLLLRVQAAWCGTCQVQAAWTPDLLARAGEGLTIVDVLIADEDNGTADSASVARWAAALPASVATFTGRSDDLRSLLPSFAPLPWIIALDPVGGAVRGALANPAPEAVLALLAGTAANSAEPRPGDADTLYDSRFTADQWALIRGMRLPDAPPPDPSNRVADRADAAAFGSTLFVDTRLSPVGRACASCHAADLLFTNGKDVASEGAGPGSRNVPTILASAHARSQLWDGRADGLWSQATIPFEDQTEMASSRLFVAHAVYRDYRSQYEAVFGPLPPLKDASRFPAAGRPGTPEWGGMTAEDRRDVSVVLANVGKAIAAFERQLLVTPNALDRYAAGERDALSPAEKDGLVAFLQAGCAQCHFGPRLSNDAYHNLRFPTGRSDRAADRGRVDGLPQLASLEFSTSGVFSDAPTAPRAPRATDLRTVGAFKTPGLRGVALTMPYGHGGGFGGLRSVIEAHRTGGLPIASAFAIGTAEPWPQGFDAALVPAIQTFLSTLRADLAPPSTGPARFPR